MHCPVFDIKHSSRINVAVSFNLKAGKNTFLTVKNTSNIPTLFSLVLNYEFLGSISDFKMVPEELDPQELRVIDLKKLRDEGVTDINGNTIPSEVKFGNAWVGADGHALLGGDMTINPREGTSYGCYDPCDPDPPPPKAPVGPDFAEDNLDPGLFLGPCPPPPPVVVLVRFGWVGSAIQPITFDTICYYRACNANLCNLVDFTVIQPPSTQCWPGYRNTYAYSRWWIFTICPRTSVTALGTNPCPL